MKNIHSQYTEKRREVALHVTLQEFKLVCYAFYHTKLSDNCDLNVCLLSSLLTTIFKWKWTSDYTIEKLNPSQSSGYGHYNFITGILQTRRKL